MISSNEQMSKNNQNRDTVDVHGKTPTTSEDGRLQDQQESSASKRPVLKLIYTWICIILLFVNYFLAQYGKGCLDIERHQKLLCNSGAFPKHRLIWNAKQTSSYYHTSKLHWRQHSTCMYTKHSFDRKSNYIRSHLTHRFKVCKRIRRAVWLCHRYRLRAQCHTNSLCGRHIQKLTSMGRLNCCPLVEPVRYLSEFEPQLLADIPCKNRYGAGSELRGTIEHQLNQRP